MKAFVTGGGGFLGSRIVEQLRRRGEGVVSFSRRPHPSLADFGIEHRLGDLADLDALVGAAKGCDIVFHVAAKTGIWGPEEEYRRTNVLGTRNVIETCRSLGIRRLVHTSSPSVVFDGRDAEGIDESAPYPARFLAEYPRSKAQAEQLVLEANSPDVATVALRPHLVWGPGDPHLVPRLLARARAGRLVRIGRRTKLVDSTYIDNAVHAHLLAAARLAPGAPIAGRAYFIAQGEPLPLWDLIDRLLAAGGLGPVRRSIPAPLAYALGWMQECAFDLVRSRREPPMTRFVARQLSTAHWFDLSAARRDLGYEPVVSLAEGLTRLAQWLGDEGS